MPILSVPDIAAIADPIIGLPYAQYDCFQLVRYLYKEGWGEELDREPAHAWKHVQEIWWQDDSDDPLVIVRPWDLLIMRGTGMASHHVGIVFDTVQFLHTRKRVGTCLERLQRWRPRFLQIARLRRLAA